MYLGWRQMSRLLPTSASERKADIPLRSWQRRRLIIQKVGASSGSAPLAACEKAIDKEDDYCTDHSTKEACRFSGLIPPDRLAR